MMFYLISKSGLSVDRGHRVQESLQSFVLTRQFGKYKLFPSFCCDLWNGNTSMTDQLGSYASESLKQSCNAKLLERGHFHHYQSLGEHLVAPWDHARTELVLLCGLVLASITQVHLSWHGRRHQQWQCSRSPYRYQSGFGCARSGAKTLTSVVTHLPRHAQNSSTLICCKMCCAHLRNGLTTFQSRFHEIHISEGTYALLF